MFGSCTTGLDRTTEKSTTKAETPQKVPSSPRQTTNVTTPDPPKVQKLDPDTLYRDIFSDDHMRAEEAVSHLRQQLEQQRKVEKPAGKPYTNNHFPSMFPASSPQRNIAVPSHPIKELPSTIEQKQKTSERQLSFDDGISGITQLTLDEIEMQNSLDDLSRVYSDITQDPIEEVEESWKQTLKPRIDSAFRSSTNPVVMSRSTRSQCTTQTKRSYGAKSLATKSTLSTQTHDFAGVWQREEQKYWEDVVREQEGLEMEPSHALDRQKKLSRAREITRKSRFDRDDQNSKRDGTITTVHSTVVSNRSAYPELSLAATRRDPDRFLDVLIMPPGTEMIEI